MVWEFGYRPKQLDVATGKLKKPPGNEDHGIVQKSISGAVNATLNGTGDLKNNNGVNGQHLEGRQKKIW